MSYNLVGIVEHQGSSIQSGHYVAYVQRGIQSCADPPAACTADSPSADNIAASSPASDLVGPQANQQSSIDNNARAAASQPDGQTSQSARDVGGEDGRRVLEQKADADQAPATSAPQSPESLQEAALKDGNKPNRSAGCSQEPRPASHTAPAVQAGGSSQEAQIAAVANKAPGSQAASGSKEPLRSTALDWYCISDTHVKRVSQNVVSACEAYILLYMKV